MLLGESNVSTILSLWFAVYNSELVNMSKKTKSKITYWHRQQCIPINYAETFWKDRKSGQSNVKKKAINLSSILSGKLYSIQGFMCTCLEKIIVTLKSKSKLIILSIFQSIEQIQSFM